MRDAVLKDTDNKQEPYYYGSIGGSAVALVPAPKAPPVVAMPRPATPSANDLARDYAFAERIDTREAWDTFLAAHKSGFYADLARAARDKLVAAEKRQKPSTAVDQKAAAQAQEAKRRAAEEAAKRQAAEETAKRKAAEEAARRQAAAEETAKFKAATEAAEKARRKADAAAKKAAEEEARLKAKLDAVQQAPQKRLVVATAPHEPVEAVKRRVVPEIAAGNLARDLQAELERVGCDPGAVNGKWTEDSMGAMRRFNRRAHAKLEVKVASLDALEAVKRHKARVCPLVCRRGYKAEDDRCVKVACRHGLVRNRDGECERPRRRAAERPAARERAHRSRGGSTGKIYCGPRGCQPVPRGCHIGWRDGVYGNAPGAALICN